MPDDKVIASRPIEPVTVAVIGTGDVSRLASGTEATTPGPHEPNLVVQIVTPLMAIAIRFLNAYFTMLVGLVTAGMATDIIPASDFGQLVIACAKLSVAGAGLGALKDIVTIFGRLEGKYPLSTGNV